MPFGINIFTPTGARTVTTFYNDWSFGHSKMPVKDGSVVIIKDDAIKMAWPALNKLTLPFSGLGGVKKGRTLIICENDIIFDSFSRLTDDEKPKEGTGLVKEWVTKKADSVCYRLQSKPKSNVTMNRIVMFIGAALMIIVISILIRVLRG